jgi:hypothetical protein
MIEKSTADSNMSISYTRHSYDLYDWDIKENQAKRSEI